MSNILKFSMPRKSTASMMNGRAIGSVIGAMMLTLRPFLGLYMGPQWIPPQLLVVLFAARLLITGTSSPAYYLLIGAGDFKTIARYVQRELIVAIILGALLGMKFGMIGVALGFLISTAFGELFQMFNAYGKSVNISGGRLMWQAWWRSGLACAASCLVGAALLPFARNAWLVFAVGAVAALTALALGLAICVFRFRPTGTRGTFRARVGELMANI